MIRICIVMTLTDRAVTAACDVLDAWTASNQASAVDLGKNMVVAALGVAGVALLETDELADAQGVALAIPAGVATRYALRRARRASLEASLRTTLGDWDDGGDPRRHAERVSKWTTSMFEAEADEIVECAVETAQKLRDSDLVAHVDATEDDSDESSQTLDSDDDDLTSEEDASSEDSSDDDDQKPLLKKQKS